MSVHVGVDPGKEGAIVALRSNGEAEAWTLPYDDAGLSGRQLRDLVGEIVWSAQSTGLVWVVERAQSFPGQGIASAFRYGRDYGVLLGVLDSAGVSYSTVPPAVWHRAVCGAGHLDPKARTRQVVEAALPGLQLRPGRRKVPHSGIVDAAGIALYSQGKGR